MKKVYVEGQDHLITKMFKEEGWDIAPIIFEADLLCLEGGADVTPLMYGEENSGLSMCNADKDVHTFGLLHIADRVMQIPVVGICRGSQALCVYNYGEMKQHIPNHGRYHQLTVDGVTYDVSSTHHQESIPAFHIPEEDIYRADDGTVELVMYRDSGHMGCQSHPEYFEQGHDNRVMFFKKLSEIL